MEHDVVILVSDFSTYPSGRNDRDGPDNGERFRKTVLLPAIKAALKSGSRVVVSLANVMSFGSSFLEEAFAGLVRHESVGKADLKRVLHLEPGAAVNERYKDAILRYIDRV